MQHRLYYSQFCYFCQKVLMALRGHQHSIEMANTSEGDNQKQLIAGGGKGQVPCLRIETAEGKVSWLYESDDILDYVRRNNLLA